MTNNTKAVAVTEGAVTVVDQYARQLDQGTVDTLKQFAPWARDRNHPMSGEEFEMCIRRAVAIGVDPFNPREVQIWKDKHGVHFQLAYTLMAEWVERCKGRHTQPQFRELDAEEKKARGLSPNDHAVVATFIMYDELAHLPTLVEMFGKDAAKAMIQVQGIGTATSAEWSGGYFAPNARDKQFKVEKRAITDAYRHKFGEPGRAEIEQIRRHRGQEQIEAQDWNEAAEALPDGSGWQVAKLAELEAANRQQQAEWETLDAEAQQERGRRAGRALFGDPDFEGFDTNATPLPAWTEEVVEAGEDEPDDDPAQVADAETVFRDKSVVPDNALAYYEAYWQEYAKAPENLDALRKWYTARSKGK